MSGRFAAAVLACAATIPAAVTHGASPHPSAAAAPVRPLRVVGAKTPPLPLARFETRGVYPQVRRRGVELRTVNAGLRAALLADERGYARYARREQASLLPATYRGVYRTTIDRRYLSASSVVVSALLPATKEVFPGQHGGDGWLGMTVYAATGKRVTIHDLFTKPTRGIRALAEAWQARIRRTAGGPCLRIYASAYTPTAAHYSAFALTPTGIAVGSGEIEACYRLVATVPYSALRPYLSKLGETLVAAVRRPQ